MATFRKLVSKKCQTRQRALAGFIPQPGEAAIHSRDFARATRPGSIMPRKLLDFKQLERSVGRRRRLTLCLAFVVS